MIVYDLNRAGKGWVWAYKEKEGKDSGGWCPLSIFEKLCTYCKKRKGVSGFWAEEWKKKNGQERQCKCCEVKADRGY